MFLDKKGMEGEIIIGLVALAIVVVLWTLSGSGLFSSLSGKADISNCNTWIGLQSKFKVEGVRLIPSDNPCATTTSTLKDKDEKEVYEHFAKKSFSCFDMYGRGKVNFFGDWDFDGVETYCFVCDETIIGEDVKTKELDLDKFEVFLSNNKAPGGKESYTDVFTGTESSRIDFGEGKINLERGDKLYTMLTIVKSTQAPDLLTGTVDTFKSVGTNVLTTIGIKALTARTVTGSFKGGGLIKGLKGTVGLSILYTAVESKYKAEYLYPSLIVAKGDEIVRNGESLCSQVHYKPKKGLLSKESKV